MAQPSYLFREGLENLKSELQHLRTVRRHDIAERIQQSRERGGTVGSAEADPSQGTISNVSPIGQGLLGKRVGDVAEVNVPSGEIRLEVLAIE